jgi:hypothetical protein
MVATSFGWIRGLSIFAPPLRGELSGYSLDTEEAEFRDHTSGVRRREQTPNAKRPTEKFLHGHAAARDRIRNDES